MKRIVSTAFTLLLFSAILQAQDAQKHISKATENIKAKKYQEAIKNLNDAKKIVTDLLGDQLAAALPKTVGGWTISENSDMDMSMMGNPNEIGVTKIYVNEELMKKNQQGQGDSPDNIDDPAMYDPMMMGGNVQVQVTISNNMMNASEVMMVHSGENMGGGNPDEEFEALRVKGYRAALRFNKQYSNGSITIIAGGGVVRIELNGVDDKSILNQFAEAVNYDTVKSILGE